MNIYYHTPIRLGHAELSDDEARHCSQVMRQKSGDQIQLLDGNGAYGTATLKEIGKRKVSMEIIESHQAEPLKPRICIALAPTKNISRIEWLIEKAVEIGVSEIAFFKSDHSERDKIKLDRLERIALSALKQSKSYWLPQLHEMTDLKTFYASDTFISYKQRFVAHLASEDTPSIAKSAVVNEDCLVLIGPEGDFSPSELELLQSASCEMVKLGDKRLRTETAALVALHTITLVNQ